MQVTVASGQHHMHASGRSLAIRLLVRVKLDTKRVNCDTLDRKCNGCNGMRLALVAVDVVDCVKPDTYKQFDGHDNPFACNKARFGALIALVAAS